MSADPVPLSTRDAALRLGVPSWVVARLYLRGLLPEPARVGGKRVLRESDLPAVEAALRSMGYLPTSEALS
jgi:hypothetical protein